MKPQYKHLIEAVTAKLRFENGICFHVFEVYVHQDGIHPQTELWCGTVHDDKKQYQCVVGIAADGVTFTCEDAPHAGNAEITLHQKVTPRATLAVLLEAVLKIPFVELD